MTGNLDMIIEAEARALLHPIFTDHVYDRDFVIHKSGAPILLWKNADQGIHVNHQPNRVSTYLDGKARRVWRSCNITGIWGYDEVHLDPIVARLWARSRFDTNVWYWLEKGRVPTYLIDAVRVGEECRIFATAPELLSIMTAPSHELDHNHAPLKNAVRSRTPSPPRRPPFEY